MHNPSDPHPDEITFNEYLDNELSLSEREKFEKHLSGCQECALTLSALKELFTQIEGLQPIEFSRDISPFVVNEIIHIGKLEPLLKRTTWLQISTISILLTGVIILASIESIKNTFSNLVNDFGSNFVMLISLISSFFNSFISQTINMEIHFLSIPHNIIPDNIPFNLLIIITVFISLLWLAGNRILLPNSSIFHSQNGG